ncbi:hypothetical protein F4Y93_11205 [Candidatus Poribacteria bacterium]|nr:hypothetical protein [Candidatus Poribacteria bacterium]
MLVVLGTFVNPINEELDLVGIQGRAAGRHTAAVNTIDDKAAIAIACSERRTAISAFFEGIVLTEV